MNLMHSKEPLILNSYIGDRNVRAVLFKNKWKASIGMMFGRYVQRYFVLDIDTYSFTYYNDYKMEGPGTRIPICVLIYYTLL